MIFQSGLFSDQIQLVMQVLGFVIFVFAIGQAPWRLLLARSERQHVFFGCVVFLTVLWALNIRALEALYLHPMAMTAVTLLLGWSLAVIIGTCVQILLTLMGLGDWSSLGAEVCLTTVVPTLTSYLLLKISTALRVQNLFIYTLGVGFFGGVCTVLTLTAATLVLLLASGQETMAQSAFEDAPLILLLMFPEGFINGTVVSCMTVFFPHLVKTFDEDFYLR